MKTKNISGSFFMSAYYSVFLSSLLKKWKHFCVTDDCIGCGKCARLCPTQNIWMETGKPIFGDGCEQCMACIQWCPEQAINYKTKTAGKRRYTHPSVSIEEMFVNK
jgi:MinD superfamily P-loop ATPase